MTTDPHGGQPVATDGPDPEDAAAVVVLFHGRGARAEGMLDVAAEVERDDVAYLAPQAAQNTWYPQSFLSDIESNEPYLSSALSFVGRVVDRAADAGVAPREVVLAGFSQGGCLATEYVARNARRYGGLVAFSGGLIGPDGTPRDYDGNLDGTPVFLGCSDRDPHIPLERVNETEAVLDDLGGDVTKRIYEGMGHTINQDELSEFAALVDRVADRE